MRGQLKVDRALDSIYDGPDLELFVLVGWDRSSFVCCLVHRAKPMIFFASDFQWCCFADQ